MTQRTESLGGLLPDPGTHPGAWDQNKVRHD